MPPAPTVTIQPAGAPIRAKHTGGDMPSMVSGNPPPGPSDTSVPVKAAPSTASPQPAAAPEPSGLTPLVKGPGKAFTEVRDKLRNKGKQQPEPVPPKEPEPAPTPSPVPDPEDQVDEGELAIPGAEPEKDDTGKPKKVSPWKLAKGWKAKAAEAEAQLLEVKKLIKNEAEAKAERERFQQIEAQNKELLEEIRYHNYAKHPEFQEKYEKPYVTQFQKSMAELKGVMRQNADGDGVPITPDDLIELVNRPTLREARNIAKEWFDEDALDVMTQVEKVRTAWESRVAALENSRKDAGEHEKQVTNLRSKEQQDLKTFAKTNWESFNKAALADPENGEFFKPVEGDTARNELLSKGYELVDSSGAVNVMDPKLTPEERASIIKKHVAIRNRAAGYGVVKYLLKKTRAELQQLKDTLGQYEGSVPTTSGGSRAPNGAPAAPTRATDQVFAELRRRARAH